MCKNSHDNYAQLFAKIINPLTLKTNVGTDETIGQEREICSFPNVDEL